MIIRPIVCRRFIGRDDELSYLHERRREAGASRGGLVLIGGEAGVGKSRLIAEFSASLAKRSRWRLGIGRCLEFVQRPYGPVLEVLTRFDPTAGKLEPAASKHEQFASIAGAFARVAAQHAIVCIIEDLHWADAATIELLTYIGTMSSRARMLMIVSYRPEAMHPEHPMFAKFGQLSRLDGTGTVQLAPLTGPELRLFIDEALTGVELSNDARRAVARASDGNPFFTEELLKNAVEHRDGPATSDALPKTVRAVLIERLRPLSEHEQRVVTQAAVIGRRFELGLLASTLGVPVKSLAPALQRARNLQLIEEESAHRFRFRHALTREAIYGGFLTTQLRPLHRTIATALEAAPPDERSVEDLAYHWWACGDAERAVHYNELAGDAAGALHAHEDALRFYERALEAPPASERARASLLQKIAGRHSALARHDAALAALSAAAHIYRESGDIEREAACRCNAALSAYGLGHPDPVAELEAMLNRSDPAEYVARSRIHLGIAWVLATFYRPTAAMRHVEQVDARAIAADPDIRLRFHNIRAWISMILGDPGAFKTEHVEWIDAARKTEAPGALAGAYANATFCFSLLGLHAEALRDADAALRVARDQRNRHAEASAWAISAFSHLLIGDLSRARLAVDAVRALPSDGQVVLAHAAAWGSLVGAYTDDQELIAYWFERLERSLSPFMTFLCGAGYAEILVRRGRPHDARDLLHHVIDLGERPRGTVLSLLAVARYGADDDLDNARAALVTAADAPAEMIEHCAVDLFDAITAQRKGRGADAIPFAASAARGFRRIRVPLLEAAALEIAGEAAAALAIYRRCGASYDVRRLETGTLAESAVEVAADAPPDFLSPRERAIASLVARGASNIQIGHELSISHKTVEKHLGSIYQKLGFSSRPQLAAYASRWADRSDATATRDADLTGTRRA